MLLDVLDVRVWYSALVEVYSSAAGCACAAKQQEEPRHCQSGLMA